MKLYSLCNTQSPLHLALPLSTKISVMELLSTASVPCSSFFFLSVCTLPHVLWGACIGLLLHPFCAGKKRKYLYIPFNVYTSVSGPAFQLSYRALSGWWLGCELQWGCKPITRKQAFLLAKNDRPFKGRPCFGDKCCLISSRFLWNLCTLCILIWRFQICNSFFGALYSFRDITFFRFLGRRKSVFFTVIVTKQINIPL